METLSNLAFGLGVALSWQNKVTAFADQIMSTAAIQPGRPETSR